jgi:hypothetical protein
MTEVQGNSKIDETFKIVSLFYFIVKHKTFQITECLSTSAFVTFSSDVSFT